MMYVKFLLMIAVISIVTWFILNAVGKPKSFVLVFLGWLLSFLLMIGVFYGLSVLVAGNAPW